MEKRSQGLLGIGAQWREEGIGDWALRMNALNQLLQVEGLIISIQELMQANPEEVPMGIYTVITLLDYQRDALHEIFDPVPGQNRLNNIHIC